MLTDIDIYEAATFADVAEAPVGSRYKVRLIEGDRLGSTGYYPADMLLRDGPTVFTKGTPMYLNHLSPEQKITRPFGSVQEFAGELAEDAYYENDGLYAEIEVFEHHRPMIKALKDKIGISIRAKGKSVVQTINGKAVPVFTELVEARSADFVVRAGAGGKIVSILESATDSETDSESQEEGQVMDEALKAAFAEVTAGQSALTATIKELAESLKPKVEETAPIDPLAIAKELAESALSTEGRERVVERLAVPGNKKTLAELIEAEEAYTKANKTEAVEDAASEENDSDADADAEESAKAPSLPSAWANKIKKDK